MTALPMVKMETQDEEGPQLNPQIQREVDRILLRLRQSKAFQRAVGHTMSSNGYGTIRLDLAKGRVKRVISEAVYLVEDGE